MIQLSRNEERTRALCPLLDDESWCRFKEERQQREECKSLEVPPGVVIAGMGFWLRPAVRYHATATLFLVSTDHPYVTEDEMRDPVLCYFSPATRTLYIGRIDGNGLEGLLPDLYPKIPLTGLTYVGRVVATC